MTVRAQNAGDPTRVDGLSLLRDLAREATCYPKTTVLVEFATFGPVLNALVGGRRGVPRHSKGIQRDEERFIPLYRQTLEALVSDVPCGLRSMPMVDVAIEQDHRENANLLAAFALLDPPGDDDPRVWAATRYAAPAAAHAAAKFALLAPVVIPAAGAAALRWVQDRRSARALRPHQGL